MALERRLVSTEAGFTALESDWHRLVALDAGTGLFNGWQVNRLWWHHYGTPGALRVLVLLHRGTVVAIAPFHRGHGVLLGMSQRGTLRFIGRGGDTAPDDLDLIADPVWVERAAREVCDWLATQHGARRWLFDDLPLDSPFARALQSRFGDRVIRRVRHERRVAVLPDTIEAWRADLSRNSRKHLDRRRRRAGAAGSVHYRFADPASLDATDSDRLAELHRTRRASLDSGSVSMGFSTQAYRDYHRALCLALAYEGTLRFVVLELDGCAIGIEYAVRHRDTLVFLQTGFDPAFAHLSPGHLLMSHLIEHAIGDGVRRLDMSKGDQDYKASYAGDMRASVSLDIVRSPSLARLVRAIDAVRDRLRRPGRPSVSPRPPSPAATACVGPAHRSDAPARLPGAPDDRP